MLSLDRAVMPDCKHASMDDHESTSGRLNVRRRVVRRIVLSGVYGEMYRGFRGELVVEDEEEIVGCRCVDGDSQGPLLRTRGSLKGVRCVKDVGFRCVNGEFQCPGPVDV